MSEYKETEVSNVPWLDPANEIEMTEEPQAKSSLGGHAVPEPGHLVTYSQKGVGEKNGARDWTVGEKEMYPDDVPADAPPTKVIAGGGTVGPGYDERDVAAKNAEFIPAPTAETSDPTESPVFTADQGNVDGTNSEVVEAVSPGGAPEPEAYPDAPRESDEGLTPADTFSPADHTVEQVQEFVSAYPEKAGDVLASEEDGKERVTLVEWLRDFHEAQSFDPSDHTVDDVKEFVNAHPDKANAVLAAEQSGKNRVTLVEWMTENKPAGAGAGDTTSEEN